MGVFSTIILSDGSERQFKTGDDDMSVFRLGDTVRQNAYRCAGDVAMPDGVYLTDPEDFCVVISKGVIADIVPVTDDTSYKALMDHHDIREPDVLMWLDSSWAWDGKRNHINRAKAAITNRRVALGKTTHSAESMRAKMREPGFLRRLMAAQEVGFSLRDTVKRVVDQLNEKFAGLELTVPVIARFREDLEKQLDEALGDARYMVSERLTEDGDLVLDIKGDKPERELPSTIRSVRLCIDGDYQE